MNSPHTKKYTLTSRLSQRLYHSLQESIFFSSQRRNSIFFSPTLRCFNFFATAQPTTDKQPESLLQPLTGQCNLTRTTEARTANKVLPKAGVTCLYDTFVLNRTLVFQINNSAETPRLRQYLKRWLQVLCSILQLCNVLIKTTL
jgi:hypothetical protein